MEEHFKSLIVVYLPYLISVLTLYTVKITGDKNKNAWVMTMLNQLLWLFWIFISDNKGFIILNLGIIYFSVINHYKWKKSCQ